MDGIDGRDAAGRLADTLVAVTADAVGGADLLDVLMRISGRAVTLLPVTASGLLVRDGGGRLRAVGSSSASAELLDLLQLQADDGPCVECLRTGVALSVGLDGAAARWPRFAELLRAEGHGAVDALPLRAGGATLGALNLFAPDPLPDPARPAAQALADIAALVLVRGDVIEEAVAFARRLERTVQARAMLSQAIGILAERFTLSPDDALGRLRAASEAEGRSLGDVARAVVERAADVPSALDLAAEER